MRGRVLCFGDCGVDGFRDVGAAFVSVMLVKNREARCHPPASVGEGRADCGSACCAWATEKQFGGRRRQERGLLERRPYEARCHPPASVGEGRAAANC